MAGRRPPFSAWVRSHAQLRRGLVKGDAQQPIWDGFFWHVSGSFKLDAVVKGPRSSSFTLDAVIVARRFTLDAQIYKPQTFPLPGPRALIRSVSQVALQPIWKTFFWSQVTEIQLDYIKSFTLDAVIQSTHQGSFTLDALALASRPGSFTLDAVRAASRASSFTLDAVLAAPRSGSFTLDALQRKGRSGSLSLDARLLKGVVSSFTLSAIHKAIKVSSFTLDAVIPGAGSTVTGSFTFDAIIAILVWDDDFNRTVASGLGTASSGGTYVPSGDFGSFGLSASSVDGSAAIFPPDAPSSESYRGLPKSHGGGIARFDFWVPAADAQGPYNPSYVLAFDDPLNPVWITIIGWASQWYIGTFWWGSVIEGFSADPSSWYTAELVWDVDRKLPVASVEAR